MAAYRDPITGRFATLKTRQQKLVKLESKYSGLSIENPKIAAALERQGFVAKVIKRNRRKRRRDGETQMRRETETLASLAADEMPKPHETTQLKVQGLTYRIETWRFEGLETGQVEARMVLEQARDTTQEENTRSWLEIGAGEADSGDGQDWLTTEFTTVSDSMTSLGNWRTRPSAGKILERAYKGDTVWYVVHIAHVNKAKSEVKSGKLAAGSKRAPAKRGQQKRQSLRKPGGAGKHPAKHKQNRKPGGRGRHAQDADKRAGKRAAQRRPGGAK